MSRMSSRLEPRWLAGGSLAQQQAACDRVSKLLRNICRQNMQRLAAACPAAWTDVWLECLASVLPMGRRGTEWSWWRGGCGHSKRAARSPLSISGRDDVSCTRLPRTRHMGESVTLTSPSCASECSNAGAPSRLRAHVTAQTAHLAPLQPWKPIKASGSSPHLV